MLIIDQYISTKAGISTCFCLKLRFYAFFFCKNCFDLSRLSN